MDEVFSCPQCQRRLKLPTEHLGKQVACPSCQTIFTAKADWPNTVPLPPTLPAPSPTDAEPPPSRPMSRTRRLEPDEKSTPPRKAGRNWLAILAVGSGICSALFIAFRDRVPHRRDFVEQRPIHDDVRAQVPLVELDAARQAEQMKTFFRHVNHVMRTNDINGFASLIDAEALLGPVLDRGGLFQLHERQRAFDEFATALARSMVRGGENIGEFQLGSVRLLPNRTEIVVVTRHRDKGNGAIARSRWWIGQRAGAWRIRDHENLDVGLRNSLAINSMFPNGIARVDPALKAEGALIKNASEAMLFQQDDAEADRLLSTVRLEILPDPLKASVHFMRAGIRGRQQKGPECIKECEQALKHNPDLPGADLLLAVSYSNQRMDEKAHKHAQAFHSVVGDEADACFEVGFTLQNLARFKEAAEYYRKALDDDPNHADALVQLLTCAGPGGSVHDITARFARVQKPAERFDLLAQRCWQARDNPAIEQLCRMMQKIDPRHAEATFYLALAHADQQQMQPALASLRTAMELQGHAPRRDEYYRDFAGACAFRGGVAFAYRELPDKLAAFRGFALSLQQLRSLDDLAELVELHAMQHASDPLLHLFRGELLVEDEQYAAANQAFARALATVKDPLVLTPFQHSRVTARYRTGDVLGAYRDIADKALTFDRLALLCWQDKNVDDLAALVEAHAKNDPDSPQLGRYRWRIKIHRQEFDEAGTIANAVLKTQRDDGLRRELMDDFLLDMVDAKQAVKGYRQLADRQQAFQVLFGDLLALNREKELRALLAEHLKHVPQEPLAPIVEAELAMNRQQWDTAAKQYAACWDGLAEDQKMRWRGSYLAAHYRAGHAVKAYRKLGSRAEDFRNLAGLSLADKKTDAFAELLDAHRAKADTDPLFGLYQSRLRILRGQPAEALFLETYKALPDTQRDLAVSSFLIDMATCDKELDAYACVPDKRLAFQTLVWRLRDKKKVDRLAQLIDAHVKTQLHDPRLILEQAELALLRDQPADAVRLFLKAREEKAILGADPFVIENGLDRARIRLGQVEAAYRESGAHRFVNLASCCVTEKNAAQLKTLLEAHREANPRARHLLIWDLEALWLSGDYEGVVRLIQENRARLVDHPGNRWKGESYLVRALVRSNRAKEALAEAESFRKRMGSNDVFMVLARAAVGDIGNTIAWLEEGDASQHLVTTCYQDEDLGPLLRGEPFAAFRQRFPEPVTTARDESR